ncbi:uncharacterized protein [Primulina eburnea]|uniref:uncharacterized protein isoform X1 n=1 Tax=Primulina eburnea TaxID=1245227 RepID=UPI003C6C3EDB
MQSAKQKVNDAAASAKEHVDVLKAKAEGKVDKTAASTKEDKEVAKEQKKAKEAEANMKKHEDKAGNAAQHSQGKQQGQHAPHAAVGAAPVKQGGQNLTGDTVPLSDTAAPGGHSDQYDSAVPVSTNAAAPPQASGRQGTLDGHNPGPN